VQLFLRGAADGTLTITVPVPVTRNQLHEAIAKKTLVPPQGQSLGSMYQYADAHNADLFYLKKTVLSTYPFYKMADLEALASPNRRCLYYINRRNSSSM
jgi:hypothetical protein